MAKYFEPGDYDTDELAIADGLFAIAAALDRLGNADASTPMGGLEALGAVLKEGLSDLAQAIIDTKEN